MAKKGTGKNAKASAVTLATIIAAGADGMFTSPEVHGPLVEKGLVEINPSMTNDAGEIATRATQAGIDSMNKGTSTAAQPQASGFVIESGIAVPSIAGRGRTATVYPFDKLEVGQSFFVANSDDRPNAAKSLASTVSSATARYAVPVEGQTRTNRKGEVVPLMQETRKFVVRSVEENGVKGARIWRTK